MYVVQVQAIFTLFVRTKTLVSVCTFASCMRNVRNEIGSRAKACQRLSIRDDSYNSRYENAPDQSGRTDGRTERGKDERTVGRTDGKQDGRTDGRMDGWRDGRTDGPMDGPTDGGTDRRTDGPTHVPGLLVRIPSDDGLQVPAPFQLGLFAKMFCQQLNCCSDTAGEFTGSRGYL